MKILWGFSYVVIYTIANVATNFFLKLVFNGDSEKGKDSYDKPIFISYVSGSSFVLFLIKFWIESKLDWNSMPNKNLRAIELRAALIATPFYYLGNLWFYYALMLTSMSALLVLNNTCIIFVFLLSIFILKDKFSYAKLAATVIWLSGILCITYDDNKTSINDNSKVIGDLISVTAAICFACYLITLSKHIPIELEAKVSFINVLGFIGLFILISFWPVLVVLHFTGLETFQFPPTKPLICIIVNIIFGVYMFDYFWGKASLLLSPIQVNSWDMLVIPISIMVDQFLLDTEFTLFFYIGTVLVVIGFMVMTYSNYDRLLKDDEELAQLKFR